MTLTEFKEELARNMAEVLEEVERNYVADLPAEPDLDQWYYVFFTAWNETIGEIDVGD